LKDPIVDERIILKRTLEDKTGIFLQENGDLPVGFCQRSNELSGSILDGEFLE
jgi:hypothetical protein